MNQETITALCFVLMVMLVIGAYLLFAVSTMRDIHRMHASEPTAGAWKPAFFESPPGQRILGLVFVLGGGYHIWTIWSTALDGGGYSFIFAVVIPFLAIISLVMLLFPFDMEKQLWEYGTTRPRNWSETPTPWKFGIIGGALAGVVNLIALASLT